MEKEVAKIIEQNTINLGKIREKVGGEGVKLTNIIYTKLSLEYPIMAHAMRLPA